MYCTLFEWKRLTWFRLLCAPLTQAVCIDNDVLFTYTPFVSLMGKCLWAQCEACARSTRSMFMYCAFILTGCGCERIAMLVMSSMRSRDTRGTRLFWQVAAVKGSRWLLVYMWQNRLDVNQAFFDKNPILSLTSAEMVSITHRNRVVCIQTRYPCNI